MAFVAAAVRAARKLTRNFSTDQSSAYNVIGRSLDFVIPSECCISLDKWCQQNILMREIPAKRLVLSIDPNRKYQVEDNTRHLFWTALIQCQHAKLRGLSMNGLMTFENLGVVKGLNIICFKNIVTNSCSSSDQSSCIDSSSTSDPSSCIVSSSTSDPLSCIENSSTSDPSACRDNSIGAFEEFVNLVLKKELSCSVADLPSEWDSLFGDLKDPKLGIDDLIYNPAFLSNEEFADMCIHIHRLWRHEMPLRNQTRAAFLICRYISSEFNDKVFVKKCKKHFLLCQFLGVHSRVITGRHHNSEALKKLPFPPPSVLHPTGSASVDIFRIGCMHSIENALLNAIAKSQVFNVDRSLLASFTRKEVIHLYRYSFPNFLPRAFKGFKNRHLGYKLELQERKPIPSLLNI